MNSWTLVAGEHYYGKSCTYLVCEATDCSEIRLREGDKDTGCSVSTNHRPVSSVKVIQRIYTNEYNYRTNHQSDKRK